LIEKKIVNYLYNTRILNKIIKTLPGVLNSALSDCESVLDIGCGPKSPISKQTNMGKKTLGIEIYEPYLNKARENKTHNEYYLGSLNEYIINNNGTKFDAVVLIDIIEHLPVQDALELIKKAESLAIKKIIINTPNGFVEQKMLDGNPYQVHLSGWTVTQLSSMGYVCKGLAGLKLLRTEVEGGEMGDDILVSIKYRPKIIFFIISAISQILIYNFPRIAFSLFSVKIK